MDMLFKDLIKGAYFIYNKDLWIKIPNVKGCPFNAIRLKDAMPAQVHDNLPVYVSSINIVPKE